MFDDIFTRHKTYVPGKLREFLNSYDPNIVLACETMKACRSNDSIATKLHQKVTKLTLHWCSSITKRCKQMSLTEIGVEPNVYIQPSTTK